MLGNEATRCGVKIKEGELFNVGLVVLSGHCHKQSSIA